MQVDEYKQLKESLNAASNQHPANAARNPPAAPELRRRQVQRDTEVERSHGGPPVQEDADSRVARRSRC